jgi:hypothetical protein
MVCLNSAASFWDLTDEMPDDVHLAVPRGAHRPRVAYPPTRVHIFASATFSLGRIKQEVESGETIAISSRVFDVERISLVTIREDAKYEGIRVVVPASLGGAVSKLRLDLSFGGPVDPQRIDYPTTA